MNRGGFFGSLFGGLFDKVGDILGGDCERSCTISFIGNPDARLRCLQQCRPQQPPVFLPQRGGPFGLSSNQLLIGAAIIGGIILLTRK